MRYFHAEQAFCSGGKFWLEVLSGLCDGVDGDEGGLSLGAQACVANGRDFGTGGPSFAGLPQRRDHPDIGGQDGGAVEAGGIAEFGDEACGGSWGNAVDGGRRRADVVLVEQAGDVVAVLGEAATALSRPSGQPSYQGVVR
ncbi:hypothetical protein [Azospirillum oleiclasticum]|uniref:hypothetical protein n=1 Tax=Azospirillum oleiclasticum TaxID=2735135 RepID=UPI001FE38FA1|nr:hypothetical protein [Azospirillum oleiclasticum]